MADRRSEGLLQHTTHVHSSMHSAPALAHEQWKVRHPFRHLQPTCGVKGRLRSGSDEEPSLRHPLQLQDVVQARPAP